MTDWEDVVNCMKEPKKKKVEKFDKLHTGLRCWECGMFIDPMCTGHYCTRCLTLQINKYSHQPHPLQNGSSPGLLDSNCKNECQDPNSHSNTNKKKQKNKREEK
jgi:hypothetical protein